MIKTNNSTINFVISVIVAALVILIIESPNDFAGSFLKGFKF